MNDAWCFLATEVDDWSWRCAANNVERNGFGDRIRILRQDKDAPLLAQVLAAATVVERGASGSRMTPHGEGSATTVATATAATTAKTATATATASSRPEHAFAFLMCNPPFFDVGHALPGHTATGKSATDSETICEGGEIGFVTQLARESAASPTRVVWFTSMLGKQASLQPLMNVLRELGASSILSTQLVQGNTMRWAIGWSFVVDCHAARAGAAKCGNSISSSSSSSSSSSCSSSESWQRTFSVEGASMAELSRRLSEYVHEEQSQTDSDFQNVHLSTLENKDWLIASDSPALQLRVAVVSVRSPVVSVRLTSLLDMSSATLLDRTFSKIERDLKRTGRYWRRKQKRSKKD
jgi:hypothetical protein